MIDLHIDPSLDAYPEVAAAIRKAHEEFSGSVRIYFPAEERWTLTRESASDPKLHLEVVEEKLKASGDYPLPNAQAFPKQVVGFLYNVWGDLLRVRSHRLIDKMQQGSDVVASH